jgi:hypothetical protein
VVVFNALSWTRTQVVSVALADVAPPVAVLDSAGRVRPSQVAGEDLLFLAGDVPGIGYRTFWVVPQAGSARAQRVEVGSQDGHTFLRNEALWAEIDPATGALSSLVHRASGREMLQPAGGNVLQLLGDTPSQWDAWNIGYTGEEWAVQSPVPITVEERGPLRTVVRAVRRIGGSVLTQDYVLEAGSPLLEVRTHADWHEEHRFLKTAFHLTADSKAATFEIPYGTIQRPTRPATEAEKARWEVSGHRWADLTDRGGEFGLTLVDDSKYGYDLQGRTLRLSLLRAPKWPDPQADQGEHHFRYGLYPHAGDWRRADSYRHGLEFNLPLRPVVVKSPSGGNLPPESALLSTDADHVVLSVFKAVREPEDRPRFAVRVHEVEGRAAEVAIRFPFPVSRAWRANLMEDRQEELVHEGAHHGGGGTSGLRGVNRQGLRDDLYLHRQVAQVVAVDLERDLGVLPGRAQQEVRRLVVVHVVEEQVAAAAQRPEVAWVVKRAPAPEQAGVHDTIIQRGARGNAVTVTVVPGVGHHHGTALQGHTVIHHHAHTGVRVGQRGQRRLQVVGPLAPAALASRCDVTHDGSVQTGAGAQQEVASLHSAHLHPACVALGDHLHRILQARRDAQLAREQVHGAGGDDAQREVRADDAAGHLAHRAVAAEGQNPLVSRCRRLHGQGDAQPGRLGGADVVLQPGLVQQGADGVEEGDLPHLAGTGVGDEAVAFHRGGVLADARARDDLA